MDFYPGSDEYLARMTSDYGDALPTHVREQVGIAEAPHQNFDPIVMGRRTYDPALAAGPAPDPMWAATRGACGPMTTACGLRSGAV